MAKYYSPDCYIRNKEKEIQINQAFLYKNNKLLKYITPQAEGLVIEGINSNSDSEEYKNFKTLIYKELDNEIDLYGRKYMIERKNGDTTCLKKDNITIIKNPKTF